MAPRSTPNHQHSRTTPHQKFLSWVSFAATNHLTSTVSQPHTMRLALQTIQDHLSTPSTLQARTLALLLPKQVHENQKLCIIAIRQMYLYHDRTVPLWTPRCKS